MFLLKRAEAHEAQFQHARRIISQLDPQPAPPEELDTGILHDALDHAANVRTQRVQGDYTGSVFVGPGQMQKQMIDPENAQTGELLAHPGSDAGQSAKRRLCRVGSGWISPGHPGRRQLLKFRIASISTAAPFGSAATPTAARAGYGSDKYSAITSLTSGK